MTGFLALRIMVNLAGVGGKEVLKVQTTEIDYHARFAV